MSDDVAPQCPACLRETTADPSLKRVRMFLDAPTLLAVLALGNGSEGRYGVDEHEQSMCKAWLDRLVDEEGNPKDDQGRTAMQHVVEEDMLAHNGSLSSILRGDDRVTMSIVVSRRVRTLDRAELREKLVPLAESYVDHLLETLYEEPVPA